MQLETLGHASLLVSNDANEPLLLTDPWLIGSTYWRSWWLQNYPDPQTLDRLRATPFVYLTHEHPDHFHPPTLRRIGRGPRYLVPTSPQKRMLGYLREHGYTASELPPFDRVRLTDDIAVVSCPQWNDDSILLIETPTAVVVDLNDAKPFGLLYPKIRRFLERSAKKVVVLSSHSAASIVHSFTRRGEQFSMLGNATFLRNVERACEALDADVYIPFASQVVFSRTDSEWANAFRVMYPDLQERWRSAARLLPPFSRVDLSTFQCDSIASEHYDPGGADKAQKIRATQRLDADARLSAEEMELLARRLNRLRWLLLLLFPSGIGFATGNDSFTYRPGQGRIVRGAFPHSIVISVPAAPLAEAIAQDRFSDLGIAMFTRIEIARRASAKLVYLFFSLMSFVENGHASGRAAFARWLEHAVRLTFTRQTLGARCVPLESMTGDP